MKWSHALRLVSLSDFVSGDVSSRMFADVVVSSPRTDMLRTVPT